MIYLHLQSPRRSILWVPGAAHAVEVVNLPTAERHLLHHLEVEGSQVAKHVYLVGGWTNPSEKYYSSQIGSSPQVVKIKHIGNHHLDVYSGASLKKIWDVRSWHGQNMRKIVSWNWVLKIVRKPETSVGDCSWQRLSLVVFDVRLSPPVALSKENINPFHQPTWDLSASFSGKLSQNSAVDST